MLIHLIGIGEVEEDDTTRIEAAAQEVCDAYLPGQDLETIMFGIGDYDADTRALFDIPEVRKWCTALYERVPYIFSLVDLMTFNWMFMCVAELEIIERGAATTSYRFKKENQRIAEAIIAAGEELIRRLAISEPEYQRLMENTQRPMIQRLLAKLSAK